MLFKPDAVKLTPPGGVVVPPEPPPPPPQAEIKVKPANRITQKIIIRLRPASTPERASPAARKIPTPAIWKLLGRPDTAMTSCGRQLWKLLSSQ